MLHPPVPRHDAHRVFTARWIAVGACGVLAAVHAMRAAALFHQTPYLGVLVGLAAVAAAATLVQLILIDDAISWTCAQVLAVGLAACYLFTLVSDLPGTTRASLSVAGVTCLVAAATVLGASLTRPVRLRTRPRAHLARRVHRGTTPARPAPPGPARPAA